MTLQRSAWNDLSQAVRDLVQARTGPVLAARTISAGLNSATDTRSTDTVTGGKIVTAAITQSS